MEGQELRFKELPDEQAPARPKGKAFLREILETLVLTAVIFFAVNSVTGRFKIFGASMNNTFRSGQYIIVNRLAYSFGSPQRGDVVVFVPPGNHESTFFQRLIGMAGETDYIKRVVGLPGETMSIEDGVLSVNGRVLPEPYIRDPMQPTSSQSWTLGPDEYFVLGDNRNFSRDSRDASVGPVRLDRIVGKVWLVYWPVSAWNLVRHYRYP